MAERPLYTLYKNLKAQNYDVPDDYNKFESALTRDGKGGADNRHAIYENLKAQNFDVPSTYERFYSALFEPRSKTSSRAKGGSVPMSAADRARFSAGAAAISASAQQTMNNAGRYNRLKQRKQKQQKDFGRVNLGTHQTPYGGDANNVVKDDFAYNPETGKTGAYVTSDNENVYSLPEAEQKQAILDQQNNAYQEAVDTGEIPSAFDVRDKKGNYDLQENIGKNGTYLTEEGAQKQFDKKLADAYARKKEIEALIAEDNRQHGNPLLSYGASIGASNGRTAEQSDYRNKLATSLSLVTEQIGALEAVKQYPTSSWGEDALKALDNTAFTAKTWDFGLTDFAIMGQMERIKTKMDNNIPLSGSDKMLLKSKLGADAATALEDEKMGNVYRWTKIAGQSLPFMADFFLTGGYGGITKGISRGALKFAAKRGMGKVGAAILKNTGIVAGDVIGSYAMAGTEQALKTGADIMQRHLGNLYQDEKGDYKFGTFDENGNLLHEGGESIGTALYKGMTSAMVENYTEKLFGHNYGIKKGAVNFMEKHGMNASAEFFKNIGKSGWYTNSKKWMEKFGINGFAEEVMEEEIGIPLHALLDGEGKVSDLLDAKQQLDIIGGMAISVGSMYAMGAGSRPVKGIYNRAQYYRFRNKVNVADIDAQNLMGDNWADIKDKIDNATNEQMGGVLADILRQRDTMTKEQINAAVNYGINLMKMRGYNIAKTAEMNAKEITNEPTTPEEQHQADIDNAYSEGHDADDADKHDIQIQQEDQMKTLAAALGISEQQLSAMSDEELESLTGQDDKLDQAIYDYQLSSARYQGVVDDAQDKVDLAAHQAEQRVDMYTDQSRGSVRNATIKASGGLEDYGVYIISGNIATHDDGSIDVSNSDDMILYYDPITNSVEHADALMFAELGEELPADEVKVQAVADAKENAIKEVAGIIDGTVEVGSQFNVTDTDGTEHTYEVLADYGDGTAAISIDGNVVENPYSLADLQKMKDLEDQKRLETAKAEREQMEKERAAQQTQNTEETQPSFDFNQILNDNGNVVLVDVLGKDGNTKYPDSRLFLIRDTGAKAKVVELKSDGTIVPHAVNKEDVATISSMSLDEYKQAMPESSMIEDNSGEIEVETPTIDGETAAPTEETAAPESAETPETEQTPTAPAITLEDGTIVPMLEDGNPDFSKLTAAQTAELYDNQFGEDADSIVSGYVSDAKKALDKASNMTVKGKTFVEQKAAKDAKEKAIADAKAAYDSAIAIRDAYNERQLAKVEDTAEGRKELIEKARRKFARLKSAVKDDAEAVSQLYRDTIGYLLHRLYDGTGIDVTDTIPLTAEEYVASNLGAHSLNYEGTETSKGVKQETGLSREDFAKTQLLAADGKGTTIDALVHSLWENLPSNLESLDTQDIRNALIGVLNSGFKASEARNFVENIRIAQAENILEEQKRAQENAAYAEQHKAEPEAELKAKSDEKAELKAKSEAKLDNESDNESNDLSNETDNEQKNDNINDNINVPEDATDEAPLGAQRDESDLPFSAKENGKQKTTAERAADVEKNKVDDMKVVDNIVGEKTRKTLEKLAKMMGANVQWQYSDKNANGWFDDKTNTIYLTLDSSITECVQFIFGHEMTHEMRTKNPAAYDELKTLVKDMMGEDAFNKETDRITSLYNENNVFYNGGRTAYEEEVVADQLGSWIRDANYAHTLLLKMSHPLLARLHEIVNRFLMALHGTEFSDDMNLILRSIEQAYVKTANGQVTNSETGEDVSFSLRQKPEPKKKGIGYKVFVLKDGKLYPPMVANPDGAATPVGVWLDADAAPIAGESKTGRPQVKQGGKGTQGGSGKLAYRPGWHLGIVPYAIQFNRKDADGNKTLFPKNFVFAEVEYAADVDYQEEARQEGINPSGKYQHSLAGLKHLPTDGYYMYRTNPNPETDPWVITGAMKVNRILTRAEQAELVKNAGREPQQIQEGDIVTDDVVNSINQEIADAPKFSLKDNQENPLNQDGTLKLDKIKSVDELTDEDFTSAFRNVELPAIPKNVDAAIGANGKPIVIKKNIFEKNWNAHKFTPAESKKVLNDALYNTDLVGHTQPTKKPNHWVAIKLDDKSPITVLEVNDNKNNVEVVGWYTLDERNLGRIKRQAERNGGELIMLTPKDDKVESLSTPPLSSAANIINSFETTKENGEKVDVEGTKFSLKDEEYLKAVEDGNMEKAQKMVNEAADAAGYSTDSSYQGTSAFNGAAPWGNGYFLTKDERKEAWDNGEFEGESTLGDYINDDIDGGNLEELTNAASYRAADPMRKEAIDNVRNAIQKKAKTITMYRSVPSDVKEGSFRNGDWVTPSRAYAVDNAKLHGWGDDYNIIEQKVPVDDVWFDGNDIAEWGYGREEDYINDTDFAYKNSKNNKKLLDAVTYDDNGNVIPLSQRFNEKNKDVRFSLKDEKTLAGVHNITEEKLRKALKLGGFANPSLAVIDTNKTGHDNFGEISFIAPSALLDKRTGNTGGTWITDAYTQRYPSVEREMSEKGYRKFEDWVDSLDYPSGAKAEIERQAKDALSDNNAPAWELMYLKEKGIDIKEYDSRIDYRWKEIISDHPTAEDILNSMKTDPELNEKVTSLAKHAIIHPTWEKVSLEVRRKMYKETGVKASPINPQVRKQTKEIFERDYAPTLLNKNGSPRKKDVKKVVEDIVKEHNDTKKYDFYLSKVKASNYVNKNGLYDDYIRWQENKLDEFGTKNRIFRGYTRDGSRKYVPETLENVSKAMREEADGQTNGSEYTSFGSFIAKLASRVDSTDEMRANKDKLSSNKDKEEFYEKWSDVYYDLAKFLYNDVFYGEQRLHDIVLQSDPKKYAKKEYGITLTPTFMKKLDALKNAVQTELKSAYFETKYNRPLRLNEFAAAVVPDNLGKDVRKGIENAGLPMYDYDPNKEGDRSRAFNEAINSSDNIRFSLAGVRGAAAADKAEERNARMDNLSVARKMEEEKKDAKAIKMATGWERGADGKWRYEIPDAKIKDTMNVGGGQIVKRYEDDMLWNGGKLSDVIDAPELFKAYPQLKGVRIDTDAIMNDMPSHGEYDSKTNTITIHADELKYMNDILNHEIQHAIQGIEGFATGGSPTTIRGEVKKRFNEVTKQIKQLRAEGKEDEAKALIEKNRGLYDAYMKNDDFNSYKSLAGEVEARNVQERMNMTPEERRKTLAESTEDVARKDQIFLGVGDVSFSLRDMADGKESGAADMAEDLKSLNTPDEVDDAIKTAIEDMPSGWKMANKKMIHIAQALGENRKAEIAGEEPKFSLKDGTLIKAGTYFSGGGLVEEGLKGIIDPVVAVEYDEKISGVYRNNFGQHIVTADVRDVDPKELVKQIDGEVEYFHASPVCKNYSQAKSNHAEVELDKETAASTAEFINAIKPKVVTIENVKGYKDSEAMKTITDALDANGYTWDADVYNAADYGGYTNRERLIVRAVRDGKLPAKPEKMARKSGWYEAVADIIPTLTEKKNGVAPWMDIRLKADGIDWRNIDKPLYVMGSAYADGKVPHAFADELLPTLRTKSGDVIVMPDGKVYRAMGRVLARVSGVSDDYKMPFSENLSHIIIGNGIPTQLTEHVIAPLLTGSDPKFSIRTYHGTGASFDKFDFSHMGEGEGSQAFGWGGYVTNSKDIAEDYTRRAKIRKDNGGFEFVTDMSANNKDMVRQYIYKYKDVNKGLDAMRKDLSSALEMFPDDDDLKELSNILAKKNEEIAVPDNIAYLYDVDIPDDNGDYLDWDAPLTDKQKNTIIKELRRLKIDFADFKKRGFSFDGSFGGNAYDFLMYALRKTKKWKDVNASRAVSKFLSSIGFTGIKYKAGTIFGGAKEGDYNYVIFDENNANIVGNTRFSLRYDQFEHDLNQWKKDNNLPKDAQRPTIPQRNAGESAVDFLRRVDEYRKQMALWKTAPTYEQHLLSDDTALGEFNRELQRGSVLKRIAFQDSMLAIRKAQEAIMKEVGVDRLNMAEDAYTAENRSHGKGKNEFEEYNNEFLQPLRKAYHQMKKVLGDSYDNVRIYMMAKHGLERDAQMAFKKSLDADYEDVAQRSAAYKAYKGDMNRIINDSDLEFGRVDFTTWRQRDNALRVKYSPSYMDYRYDKNGIAYDYSGLSALFDGSDFEETAHKLVKDIEDKYVTETHNLWDATNAATKKILRDGYKAGMMSKDTYQYVRDMYSHYIPLRGWDGTTADQVWDYIGGGKGAFNQTLKKAHGRTSIADDPIAYIENMAESGILLNNKNWVKQHLMLLAQNHPTSLLTLSKAWYVKSVDDNGNEEWIPATPQITSQMNSNQVKAAIDAFEKKMEQMAQAGDATQKRDGLNIAYPQTHSEEREHEVRVMKDGDEYVIYVNGDPQLAQAMNNTRAHRVREIQSGKLDRAAAWLGRKMAAAYTSLSPLFIPSNYFRDLTMTLASTAIREDGRYNYLLRKNLATSWNLGFMLRDYQNGKLRDKVNNGNATPKEQMFYDFMMNGGETGFVSSLDVEDLKKKFKNDLKDLDRWKTNPVKVGHTIMDGIEFLNRAIEDSNRFAVYMTSIQYGRSIDEAVNDAKDVTLNFNRKGTGEYGWQMIRNLYLFINPAVQSLQTLGALAKHHPFKFTAVTASWLASGVLVPIVNAALMSMLGGDDDKDKYWQFTKWDRRNNLIMWVPYTHEYVKIPLAQEFRAFYGIGDMIASKMMGGELAEESWSQYAEDLLGQVVDMLPLDPTGYDGNIAVSLMPNAIRPVFELAFNVDFTGKPLFKETEYNKYDPNFTKAYVGTPDWLVRASRMVNSIGNDYPDVQQNSIDAFGDPRYNLNNPAVVDHVLSSYLGGAYTMGSQVLGLLTKSLNDPKEIKVADIPLFSKFVSNPDDRPVTKKQGDEFWNMKENHDRAANTLSKLKKQAKVDGDYSMLERFYGSEEYKKYKQDDVKVKKYEEDKKKERAEDSGEEYRPHKLNAEDIYKAHATPKDDFEDLKLKQLYTKLNGFKTSYDLLVDTAPSQSDGYYNNNKAAIDAIDEISLDKQEISELKKGFLDDGKDAYNAEDMKQIRDLRKKILSVLEKANKVVVANQKAKAKK